MSRSIAKPGLLALFFAAAALSAVLSRAWAGDPVPGAPPPSPAPSPGPTYVPEPFDVAIVLSGIERGVLKPCNCTTPMMGGLNRRAALMDLLRGKSKSVGAVSLGDALGDASGRVEPAQSDLKADLLRGSLAAMGYGGSVLGITDLYQSHLVQPNGSAAETPQPPFNVKLSDLGTAAALAKADRVVRFAVGDLLVRAVSVVDPTAQERLVPDGIADAVIPPAAALRELPKEKGLLIVAAHASREDIAQIRAAVEGKAEVVVVVDAGGEVAYDRPVASARADHPLVVKFDEHGKEVGVVSLVTRGGAWWVAYRSVVLDPSFEEGPSKGRDEVDRQFEVYKRRVREDQVLAKFSATFADAPDKARYVGSAECRSCHAAIYEQWQKTPHARALEALKGVGYDWDPECVRCHTVGWNASTGRTKSSFLTPEATPHLAGVGCESCHGPGSLHVKRPDDKSLFGAWKKAENCKDIGRSGCVVCHDPENSPHFSDAYEKAYRPRVDHREVPKEQRTTPPAPPLSPTSPAPGTPLGTPAPK